jgi:MFS family permease
VEDTVERVRNFVGYSLIVLIITHTLTHVAGSIRTSLYPLIKEEFSLTNQQIGIIAAIPPLVQALVTLPTGALSDRFGAKSMISVSILMAALGSFLAGLTLNPLMFIMATTLLTLNSTFYHPPANSYVTKKSEPSERAMKLGLLNSGGTFGFALGPLSITILMEILGFPWRNVYLFWIIPILLGLVAIYLVDTSTGVDESTQEREDGEDPDQEEGLISQSMVAFLSSTGIRRLGSSMTIAFLSIYLVESQGWNIGLIGIMFFSSRLMGLVASPLGGWLTSHYGEKSWATLAFAISYILFLLAFIIPGLVPFFILYLGYSFMRMLAMPATSSITAMLSPRRQRGIGYALSFLPGSLVRAIGPIIAAYIADTFGLYPIFMISVAVFFIGLGIFQFGVRLE